MLMRTRIQRQSKQQKSRNAQIRRRSWQPKRETVKQLRHRQGPQQYNRQRQRRRKVSQWTLRLLRQALRQPKEPPRESCLRRSRRVMTAIETTHRFTLYIILAFLAYHIVNELRMKRCMMASVHATFFCKLAYNRPREHPNEVFAEGSRSRMCM